MVQKGQPARTQPSGTEMMGRRSSLRIMVLLVGMGLLMLGYGLQGTLISVRGGEEGMSNETIGFIMSAYFVGFVGGSLFFPRLVENVGHIRVFAALASISSVVALASGVFIHPLTWALLRGVHGVCYAGLLLVVESWLNTATSRSNRGRVLAIYGVVLYGAWAASQPLLNLSSSSGLVLFMLVAACLSLAPVPITLTRAGGPGVVSASRAKLGRLYRISPLALAGVFTVGATTNAFFSMGPRFAQLINFSNSQIAAFISLNLIGAVTLQWPLGWLSDRMDRRLVIILGAAATAGIAVALAMLTQDDPIVVLALSFVLGGFALPLYSICIAQMNDQIDQDEVIMVASGLILVFGIGSIAGPFTASLFMGQIGPPGLFVFMAGMMGLYATYAFWDAYATRRTPNVEESDKDTFVGMPHTSHASTPLHKHGSGKATGKVAPR